MAFSSASLRVKGPVLVLERPFKPFDGQEGKWSVWRIHAMEHFDHLGIRAKVDAVRKMTDNELLFRNLDEDAQVLSVAFGRLLKVVCISDAKKLIDVAEEKENGFLAWKCLLNVYEPRRFMDLLVCVLHKIPKTWTAYMFIEDIKAWERKVTEYEAEAQHQLEGPTRIATVRQYAPREFQAWVSNAVAHAEGDWDTFKVHLEMRYCSCCREWGTHLEKDCKYACTDEVLHKTNCA